MGGIFRSFPTAFRIAVRRLNGNRRLMAAVAIGVVLAVALMASTTIYRNALQDLGLQTDLRRVSDAELDVRILNAAHGLSGGLADESFDTIDRRLRIPSEFISDTKHSLTTATFFMTEVGGVPPDEDPRDRARVLWFEAVREHIELVEGQWPDPTPAATPDQPPVIDVAMGTEAAASGGFSIGEVRDIHASWRDDARPIQIRVVGLVRPLDYNDRYWGVRRDHFHVPVEKTDAFAFFAPRSTLIDAMAGYMPELRARLEAYARVDRSAFVADDAGIAAIRFRAAFEAIAKEIERTRVETEIVNVLKDYETKEFFSSIPLLVLTLQIVGIVLFYLVLVSTMVVDRQSGEVALLKSRGAGMGHIMSISTIEGLILVALAMGVGPIVAREAIAFLGYSPAFEGLTGGTRLSVELTGEVYIYAAIGAALSFIALIWPAWRSNRSTVVHHARSTSRPEDKPVFQRYYLDLVVVAVGALLFFQLQESGSLVTEDLFGGLQQDPLLLIAPAVFVVTVAVLFLRLFPLLLSAFGGVARLLGGASTQMVLWHLTRAPVQPGRLALLLIMATSLGMFGGTFGATLDKSFDDRAAYQSGAPLRLADLRSSGASADMLADDLAEAPGIDRVSYVIRQNASFSRGPLDVTDASVLGVDPESFSNVLWYRDDFALDDVRELIDRVTAPEFEVEQIVIPADATYVGMWIWLPDTSGSIGPSLRLQDSQGRYRDVRLIGLPRSRGFGGGELEEGWRFLYGVLKDGSGGPHIGPWTLQNISIRSGGNANFSGSVGYDSIQYTTDTELPEDIINVGFRDSVIIESFEQQGRWTVFTDTTRAGALPDDARLSTAQARDGEYGMSYRWNREVRSGVPRGVRLIGPDAALPVIVSRDFLVEAALDEGQLALVGMAGVYIPMQIVGAFDLFPTWDPEDARSLIIANRDYLSYRINRNPATLGAGTPNEVWIQPTDEEG
ncbi:MAG: FtsX-like permease family protein, partial [Chloroflexi bacterium]|nr:FtsX-like permease family protein [Chloroflexota bacterium]